MSWFDTASYCVFDTETTGVDPSHHRVIELGYSYFSHGLEQQANGILIHPWPGLDEMVDLFIDDEIFEITKISREQVKAGQPFNAADGFFKFVFSAADFLVAYNAPFDVGMIGEELVRHDMRQYAHMFDVTKVLDPLVWIREKDKYLKGAGKYRLGNACERYGVKLTGAHRAQNDAKATGLLLQALFKQKVIPDLPLAELLKRQTRMRDEQDADYKAFLAKKGNGGA